MSEKKKEGRFFIVTGMSGAGKSTVLKMLEDDGFFCVDNLPARFLPSFPVAENEEGDTRGVAVGIDIRNGKGLLYLEKLLPELKENGAEIIFLEALDESLVIRYKETRRLHPLLKDGRVEKAIALEREKIAKIKSQADYILDTSRMLVRELREQLNKILVQEDRYQSFVVTFLSFGFKYGIPCDADLVFDVRFLPNPYYIKDLKDKTGNDKEVFDFVMEAEDAQVFFKKLIDMLDFLIPKYIAEGKTNLVVGIGCTGGKHRSVTLARALYQWFSDTDYSARIEHREI